MALFNSSGAYTLEKESRIRVLSKKKNISKQKKQNFIASVKKYKGANKSEIVIFFAMIKVSVWKNE